MSRLEKLENHYQKQLTEHNVKNVSNFIHSIIDADITKGKYSRFLIDSFLNDKFLEEDLVGGLDSTVGQAISLFDKHKGKLPVEQRSVYALDKETGEVLYQSPGNLWNKVKQYQGELSGKELKKEEQEQIYRETEFIYKDEETSFQIVSPLTKESAQWWGKGTRWCTSADNNNIFERYARTAPLFILLMPNGDKLQLWKKNNRIQFMDESDNDVDIDYIEQYWTILEPLCLWLNDIRFIPIRYKTFKFCKLAIQQNSFALQYVPEKYKTQELCELAVQENGMALSYVPDIFKTQELCELAVKNNSFALEHVPYDFKTKELCEIAVQKYGDSLQYVPEELKTKDMCELAVQQNGSSLKYIPYNLITKELCKLTVKNYGYNIQYIPEEYITKELCELVVSNYGNYLQYVPDRFKTPELCKMAVQQNSLALQFVPEMFFIKNTTTKIHNIFFRGLKYLTKKDFYNAVEQNGIALKYIPEKLRTKKLCKLAIQNNSKTLQYIPEKYKTKKMCEIAVNKSRSNILYCSKNYRTQHKNIIIDLLDEKLLCCIDISNYICNKEKKNNIKEISNPAQKEYSDLLDLMQEYNEYNSVNNIKTYIHPDKYNEIRHVLTKKELRKQTYNQEEIFEINKSNKAINDFCEKMKEKMLISTVKKGRRGWDNPNEISKEGLIHMLKEHIDKGDMRDVGLFAMMIWFRDEYHNGK